MTGRKRTLQAVGLLVLITAVIVAFWQGRLLDIAAIVQGIGELGPHASTHLPLMVSPFFA